MYKAIASVGTLLLNLGELSAQIPDTSSGLCKPAADNPPIPVEDDSSNRTEPVKCSVDSVSNPIDCPNLSDRLLDKGSSDGSPLSDASSAQRRLCEALADAATDSSPGSNEHNANDDEFVRVGSEDSLLSTPEVIDLDDEAKCNVEIDSNRILLDNPEKTTTSPDRLANDSDHSTEDSEKVTKTAENADGEGEKIEGNSCESVGNKTKDVEESGALARRRSSGNVDPHWCITFEQFLASVLTETLLVEYFEEQTNIEEIINTIKTEGVRDFVRNPRRSLSVE